MDTDTDTDTDMDTDTDRHRQTQTQTDRWTADRQTAGDARTHARTHTYTHTYTYSESVPGCCYDRQQSRAAKNNSSRLECAKIDTETNSSMLLSGMRVFSMYKSSY